MTQKIKELTREEMIELSSLLFRFQMMVEGDDIYKPQKQIGQVVKRIDNYLK